MSTSFDVPHASNKGNVHQDEVFKNKAMPILNEYDKSSWECRNQNHDGKANRKKKWV